MQQLPRQEEGNQADRDVDEENPAPTIVVGNPPTQDRTDGWGRNQDHRMESDAEARLSGGKVSIKMACATGARPPPATP